MSQNSVQANNYIRSATGLWAPVGFGATDQRMPTVLTSPNGAAAGLYASMTAYGYQRATGEPGVLFAEPFDGSTLDTTNRWNAATGTVAVAGGSATMSTQTVSTVHNIISRPTFAPSGLNLLAAGWVAQFEANPLNSNISRFMGFGTAAASPGTTQPVIDGVGFEFPGDGTFRCVVWQNGVRSASSVTVNASATAGPTRYGLVIRSDLAIFYAGTTEVPIAVINFVMPNVQTLPLRFQRINGTSVTNTPTMVISAVGVHDTGHNSSQISDGNSPWRRALVDAAGNLAVRGPTSVSTALSTVTTGTTAAAVTLMAANANRLKGMIYNATNAGLYIGLTTTAYTATPESAAGLYTALIATKGYYELPDGYSGGVMGWQTGTAASWIKVTQVLSV